MLMILSGCSGAGKNTIIEKMLEIDSAKYQLFKTYTTREKRNIDGDEKIFHFVDKETFQTMIKNNEFIEYEHIHNNFYGSTYAEFRKALKDKKTLLKDIGVQGTQEIKTLLAEETEVVTVFLQVRKRELKKRLKRRAEKSSKLRLKRYKYENKFRNKYDFVIKNKYLDKTTEILECIANHEKVLFNTPFEKLNERKLKVALDRVDRKLKLKPIRVVYADGKLYCVKGEERYLASLTNGINICKKIKAKKCFKPKNTDNEIYEKYFI